jgi:hypothetical protein
MARGPDNESRFARTCANLAHSVPAPTLGFGACLQFRLDLPGGERPGYAGKPPGGCPFSAHKRVSVVVDVGFAQMLGLGILVRLMLMVDRGMAVLVIVSVHHVLPVRPVTMVVNDVIVLMTMHDGVMMMHRHCSSTFNPCVCLAVAMWPGTRAAHSRRFRWVPRRGEQTAS